MDTKFAKKKIKISHFRLLFRIQILNTGRKIVYLVAIETKGRIIGNRISEGEGFISILRGNKNKRCIKVVLTSSFPFILSQRALKEDIKQIQSPFIYENEAEEQTQKMIRRNKRLKCKSHIQLKLLESIGFYIEIRVQNNKWKANAEFCLYAHRRSSFFKRRERPNYNFLCLVLYTSLPNSGLQRVRLHVSLTCIIAEIYFP